jgi:hypothetical protein
MLNHYTGSAPRCETPLVREMCVVGRVEKEWPRGSTCMIIGANTAAQVARWKRPPRDYSSADRLALAQLFGCGSPQNHLMRTMSGRKITFLVPCQDEPAFAAKGEIHPPSLWLAWPAARAAAA